MLLLSLAGFYADPEARCQVFHVCGLSSGQRPQQSFLCPNGTLFNVQVKTCDWWTNVECSSNPVQEVEQQPFQDFQQQPLQEEQQPLKFREETQLLSQAAKPNIKESQISYINHNGKPYRLPKSSIEKEVKINFNRSKFLLDAFNTKVNTYDSSSNNFSNTLVTEDDKDTDSSLRGAIRKEDFPIEVGLRTIKEVSIQPRIKYTHSNVRSSTKSPILSVTINLDPTENSFVKFKDTTEQNKNLKSDRANERKPLQKPSPFFDMSRDAEFDTGRENNSDLSKYEMNKLHQDQRLFDEVSPIIANITEQHSFLPTDYLYYINKKPLKEPGTYYIQDTTDKTRVNSKIRNYSSVKEVGETSSDHNIDREKDFESYDRDITTHNVAKGDRTTLNEAALVRKLVGENGLFTLLMNEFHQEIKENPENLSSTTDRYLNKFVNDKKNKKNTLALSDALSRTEEKDIYVNKNANPSNLDRSKSFSENSFVLNEFANEHGSSQSDNLLNTGLNGDFKEGNNQLQKVRTQGRFDSGKPLSKELEQGISISKQNLTYEEHIIESLPKIKVQPELSRNTKSSSKSYVSVPNFSSFPELYTSPVSGYYITELPQEMKQIHSNFKKNYDGRVKNRITRLDGERYKLESTTENSLETNSDLLLSETESIYATPKSTSTHLYEEIENQFNSKVNLNTPVTEETLLQAPTTILPLDSNQETIFENEAFLGPELSFENSHIIWPNFPPRSIFYSPYPALKRSKSQFGATESLSFFPRPPKRNRVNPSNNNALHYNDANHDQESSQATENYSSSTSNVDLAQVLQKFLSHSPDKVVKNYSDTILIQPTVEVYSESTSSNPLEDTSFKLDSPSPILNPLEIKQENDSPTFSTLQSTDYKHFYEENAYGNLREEFKYDDLVVMNHTNSQLITDLKSTERSETQESLLYTSQSSSTPSSDHNHDLRTILEPPDVLDMNGLQSSPKPTAEDSFKYSEIVKSLSFDLDSPEDREQFEAAKSKGLFKR